MIKEATSKLIEKRDLNDVESYACINEIMSGQTSHVQTAAFLVALAAKNETIDEITACAVAMRNHALKMENHMELLDIVGTGGDCSSSFNISTTASIVIASGDVKIAKHGNRAASSNCGAADCLESLGVNINLDPEKCLNLLNEVGICFFFAQKYHTSMKYVGPVRKELGVRTVFNLLGPLTNPASPCYQILGVYSEEFVKPMARVLYKLGVKRGMVVFGQDKLDEISMSCPTSVCEFGDGDYNYYVIKPEDFGFKTCDKSELLGGTPKENADITLSILRGDRGPKRDIILLNAGAALYIAGKVPSFKDGINLATELIDSGKAMQRLETFKAASNR